MESKLSRSIAAVAIILALFYMLPNCLSENYTISYQLLNHIEGSVYYGLNVVIPDSLYEYYNGKTHSLSSESDFAKFVTPYALKPMAESLRDMYQDDEDFANGVLMIVHQIPYQETVPPKYPAETIAENKGDCDLFSDIAASIMKADGLDVVLLYYEQESHMNVGVHLSHAPQDARGQVYSVTCNGITYYIAECTGTSWEDGWRVGECPDELRRASVQVITLENSEDVAPGQVSASYTTQEPTTLSLDISSNYIIQGSKVTIYGQLTPALQNKNITFYIKATDYSWNILATVITESNGHFDYTWQVNDSGICSIRAACAGDEEHAGSISPIKTVTVIPMFFVLLLSLVLVLACLGAIVVFTSKHSNQQIPEPQAPQPPEIPS